MKTKALAFLKEKFIYFLVFGVLAVGVGIGFNLGYDSALRDAKQALFSRLLLK